jgi:hypothetical protein
MRYYLRPEVPGFETIVELPGRKDTIGIFGPIPKVLPEGYNVVPLLSAEILDFCYFSATSP